MCWKVNFHKTYHAMLLSFSRGTDSLFSLYIPGIKILDDHARLKVWGRYEKKLRFSDKVSN